MQTESIRRSRVAMARYAKGTVGRVRIETGATACIDFLPSVLRQLRARFPSLDIVVSTGNTPDILERRTRIDVGGRCRRRGACSTSSRLRLTNCRREGD
jgi:DNA-binding transcriptional LysR family regulator